MKARFINEEDLSTANDWLVGWGLNPLPKGMYPTTGLMLSNEEADLYIGFIWTSNSKMAQIGFITRNPNYKKKLPKNIKKEFISSLCNYAKEMGYDYVITWTDNKFLVNDFKELGFTETSNTCSELIIKI